MISISNKFILWKVNWSTWHERGTKKNRSESRQESNPWPPKHRAGAQSIHWVKPWSNGVASRRNLKTWVYLWLRLARACVHLSWLEMTCAHFGRDQICTQVKASFSPFGHPSQVNASWVTSISLSLANEISIRNVCLEMGLFADLRVLVRKIACPFWAQVNASARKAWPNGVASRPKFSTGAYLRLRLVRA